MSKVIQLTSTWPGLHDLSYLIIFGDSYSSLGYEALSTDTFSTAVEPLGVPFPGDTWNEEGLPNWVGHFITKYLPRPCFIAGSAKQDEAYLNHPLLVYDYAKGGAVVEGVTNQIRHRFLPNVGQKPEWASWSSGNTLFVTWIGINDCAYSRVHTQNMQKLFSVQEELYEAGARNFLFVDVPPINRSPAVSKDRADPSNFINFNIALDEAVRAFAAKHEEITVLLFSAAATFNRFLDAPEDHGFLPSDCRKPGGGIWVDRIHPTSAVHGIIAKDIAEFLGAAGRQ